MKKITFIILAYCICFTSFADSLRVKLPTGFIENKGQIYDQNLKPNSAVKYLLNSTKGLNIQLKTNSFSYDVYTANKCPNNLGLAEFTQSSLQTETSYQFQRVDVEFLGANPSPIILAEQAYPDYLNYYTGTPSKGITSVKHFRKITYKNIYPFIDLEFLAEQNHTAKYNFIVHSGGDISQIKWIYKGTEHSVLSDTDDIHIYLDNHIVLKESIPLSYWQESSRQIDVHYKKKQDYYSFDVQKKDIKKGQTLIIDPQPDRIWVTYLGGANDDNLNGIRLDDAGNLYVVGTSYSNTAIATTGAYQVSLAGNSDMMIAKFNSSGVRQWATYYGGSDLDDGRFIAVKNNFLVVSGYVQGAPTGMTTTGAHQTTYGGGIGDAFIARFNLNGFLEWGTYYGGTSEDYGFGCAIDNNENIYLTAYTYSSGLATAGAYQIARGGDRDGLLVKFNSNGVRLWATYYGGLGSDEGYRVVTDNNNNVYLGGFGTSNNLATIGTFQSSNNGSDDAFLVKFDASGVRQWATYCGGVGSDRLYGLFIDSNSNLYFTGYTSSTGTISSGCVQQTSLGGSLDAYLMKFDNNGQRVWGTYYGGSNDETGFDIGMDSFGDIYLTGRTSSSNNIASSDGFQASYGGGSNDMFLAKFDSSGQRVWGTYCGSSNSDDARNCVVDSNNDIYIVGYSFSSSNIATVGSHQPTFGGLRDAVIAKFDKGNVVVCDSYDRLPPNATICPGNNLLLDATINDACVRYVWQDGSILPTLTVNTSGTYNVKAYKGSCLIMDDNIVVGFYPPIQNNLGPDQTLNAGQTVLLTALEPNASYIWSTGSNASSIIINSEGLYWLEIVKNGCRSRDSVIIRYLNEPTDEPIPNYHFLIPNVITPNGDGINDSFEIVYTKGNAIWDIEIYNRFGKKIYDCRNYKNDWKGDKYPSGLYYYVVYERTEKKTYKGWLQIFN